MIAKYVSIILTTLVQLLYTPLLISKLGQSEYGLYSLVASVISYLTVLDLGLGNAIVRYTAKFRAEGKTTEQYEIFGMFLVLYIIIGVLAFVAGLGLYINVDTLFAATMTVEELDKARIMMIFLIFNLAVTFPMSIWIHYSTNGVRWQRKSEGVAKLPHRMSKKVIVTRRRQTVNRKSATCAAIFARFCLQNRFLTRTNGREGRLWPDQ